MKKLPEGEKPREKLLQYGAQSLSTAELLAILFRYGTRKKTALDLGHELLKECREDLREIYYMEAEELMEIEGIGPAKATTILASVELSKRMIPSALSYQIDSPSKVYELLSQRMSPLEVEEFAVIMLDTKNRVIKVRVISQGTLNSSIVHPREVFAPAIKARAHAMILVHNHPSGDVEPSKEDRMITKRLVEVSKIVGIAILDHVIIGKEKYYSFQENLGLS